MRPQAALLLIEVLALVAFLGLAGGLVYQQQRAPQLVPLDIKALAAGVSQEQWYGIFLQDQHIGYSLSRRTPTADGGALLEGRARFRMLMLGKLHDVVVAEAALVDATGSLSRFDFFLVAGNHKVSIAGVARDTEISIDVLQGGEVSHISLPIAEKPQITLTVENLLRSRTLAAGEQFTVPIFNPLTLGSGQMTLTVREVEVLENGEEAWWVHTELDGSEGRQLVLPSGEVLREESALFSRVRMTAEAAQDLPKNDDPVDIISETSVPIDKPVKGARDLARFEAQVRGVDPERVPHSPPLQLREGDALVVTRADLSALPSLPIEDRSEPRWVDPTPSLPAAHPELRERAQEVIGDAPDRLEAVRRLNTFVFEYLDKVPTISVPNGLAVLRSGEGDCNEHTALFVSLARAAGIPARTVAGVVYSERVTAKGGFYYHAWPEVRLGGEADWIPLDPTFGQLPADATHVKLIEGELDRQVEIMSVMGRLAFGAR